MDEDSLIRRQSPKKIFRHFNQINLAVVTLDQITGINATSSGVEMNFSDGSTLNVLGNEGTNYNFKLADGSAYTYSSGEWTKTA